MTRHHWFARLIAALLGAWGGAGAAPQLPCRAPRPHPGWPAPTDLAGPTTSSFYDASNRLIGKRGKG